LVNKSFLINQFVIVILKTVISLLVIRQWFVKGAERGKGRLRVFLRVNKVKQHLHQGRGTCSFCQAAVNRLLRFGSYIWF
jgi:hypothetical protein